ncbi:MAG: IS110 family transposase [Ottowia sp.]|nr:IS110 family transposase [Ottowia sp.]
MHSAAATSLPIVAIDLNQECVSALLHRRRWQTRHRRITHAKLLDFFTNRSKSLVAMEACGSAHYWARVLMALGHEVRLLPAQRVKSFVQRDKTDAKDAHAICVACQQPHIKSVPVKSQQQQAWLMLHRRREQLKKQRIMFSNAVRGHLSEFGIVLPEGFERLCRTLPDALVRVEEAGVPREVIEGVQCDMQLIAHLQQEIERIERKLAVICKQSQLMLLLMGIPGIGSITASAIVASAPEMLHFASARQFVSWLGLAPAQTGTGGKTRQLGLSKRGNSYLRCLLMHCARSLAQHPERSRWLTELMQRRPRNVAVAALAGKLARTIWAVLTRGEPFAANKWNPCEGAAAAA